MGEAMSDATGEHPVPNRSTVKRIEEFAGFHQAPVVLAGVGFLVTLIATFLPFASVSISAFGGNIGAYEGSSPSPWLLSLPIAWIAILFGLVVLGCAVAHAATEQSPGTDHVLAVVMTATGVVLLVTVFFELFWVGHRVEQLAGFLSSAIDTTMAIGYVGLLLGAAILTASGVAMLLKANAKKTSTAAPFS